MSNLKEAITGILTGIVICSILFILAAGIHSTVSLINDHYSMQEQVK